MSIVLVFGGSGFVGCHVAKAFRRAGYRVYAASRSGNRSQELLQAEVLPILVYEAALIPFEARKLIFSFLPAT
jgi:nucleoside-diphosphate-sugar epimerase